MIACRTIGTSLSQREAEARLLADLRRDTARDIRLVAAVLAVAIVTGLIGIVHSLS